jgi:hypothetical protein
MNRPTIRRVWLSAALAASALAVAVPAAARTAPAADPEAAPGQTRTCAQKFDEAQRTDMESFRDFDRDTWLAGHDTPGHAARGAHRARLSRG